MDGSVVAIRVIRWKMIVVSFITWFMLIHYFERTNTRSVINSCHWGSWETWEKDAQPHRVALVADPQIVDDHSYARRPRLLDYLLKKVTDNYLYRNHILFHFPLLGNVISFPNILMVIFLAE